MTIHLSALAEHTREDLEVFTRWRYPALWLEELPMLQRPHKRDAMLMRAAEAMRANGLSPAERLEILDRMI